jgi:hypothetical protein
VDSKISSSTPLLVTGETASCPHVSDSLLLLCLAAKPAPCRLSSMALRQELLLKEQRSWTKSTLTLVAHPLGTNL